MNVAFIVTFLNIVVILLQRMDVFGLSIFSFLIRHLNVFCFLLLVHSAMNVFCVSQFMNK
uniref:Candidate secreted effector n=1 Tax=Meloidogyne incognita TaxID=6306 RepID=A0A914P1B7_MELIC